MYFKKKLKQKKDPIFFFCSKLKVFVRNTNFYEKKKTKKIILEIEMNL